MTPETRVQILISRSEQYYAIMRTTMFVFVAIAAIIEFGPGGYSAPLTCLVIAISAYGILAGGTALDDIINLRDDMDEAMAGSAYGAAVKARNIPMLKTVSSVLIGLVGVAELFALFT